MSIQWGKTGLGAGIWNSRMMSEELMREAIRLLISSYLHSLPGDQLWDLGPLCVTRGIRISFPIFRSGPSEIRCTRTEETSFRMMWLRIGWEHHGCHLGQLSKVLTLAHWSNLITKRAEEISAKQQQYAINKRNFVKDLIKDFSAHKNSGVIK